MATESVESVLNRLYRYYGDRAKSSASLMHNALHSNLALEYAVSSASWEAQQNAVTAVAKNLDIKLKGNTNNG